MLTNLIIRNFKLFEEVEIPLGNGLVFVGANNSGKTSALQALALWQIGLQKWAERYSSGTKIPKKRPGVTVNRLDLLPLPVAKLDLIWFNRKAARSRENVRIDLIVEGISEGEEWQCGLEFEYFNPEALFCRPLRKDRAGKDRMEIPKHALKTKIAFLPPMSGLVAEEALIREGRINVLLGQGQTAEVLRNLCFKVYQKSKQNMEDDEKTDDDKKTESKSNKWNCLVENIENLFGITINEPQLLESRGAVTMSYQEQNGGPTLDLPSSGRGMQQVLLLLAHLYDNAENTVFLLDEPDSHLEMLRQRQVYNLITDVAQDQKSQIISASHSEVLLNESVQRDAAVAFVGNPHLLSRNQEKEVLAALREIGYEYYFGATQKGWILYLEGETDLKILLAFARKLKHPAEKLLLDPLVKYFGSNRNNMFSHFNNLKAAKNDLQGFILLDRIGKSPKNLKDLSENHWSKREIENYLCIREAIVLYVTDGLDGTDIFDNTEFQKRKAIVESEIDALENALKKIGNAIPFSDDIKASDEFLIPLFRNFTKSMKKEVRLALQKKDFYKLVEFIPDDKISPEITEKLDALLDVAEKANPGSRT